MRCPCRNCLLIPICKEKAKRYSIVTVISGCSLCKKFIRRKNKHTPLYSKREIIRYFLLTKPKPKKKRKKY